MPNLTEFGHGTKGRFVRNIFITASKIEAYRKKYGNIDCYASVLERESFDRDENPAMYGPLVFDFDIGNLGEDSFEVVRTHALKCLSFLARVLRAEESSAEIFFSGSKGIHVVVPPEALGIESMPRLNEVYRAVAERFLSLADAFTLDFSLYGWKALFRLPNSVNSKTGLYKIPLTHEELRNLSFAEIAELAKNPRELPKPGISCGSLTPGIMKEYVARVYREKEDGLRPSFGRFKDAGDFPCIRLLLRLTIRKGQRNKTACIIASHLLQKGFQIHETFKALTEWTRKHCIPPLTHDEVQKVIDSMYAKGYAYGCTAIREMGVCVEERCSHRSRFQERAV